MVDLKKSTSNLANALIQAHRMSHASVVVSAAAILEHDLERGIKTRLRPLDNTMTRRIFGAYSPLGTFAAKIDMAYALDITTTAIHLELNKVREIRHKFSHSPSILSLDKEPVLPIFNSLVRPPGATGNYSEVFMACIISLDDFLEKYLLRMGITDDLSEKNRPPK
jgi:hypothetical protein